MDMWVTLSFSILRIRWLLKTMMQVFDRQEINAFFLNYKNNFLTTRKTPRLNGRM
jgi:hypothetical protein